MKYLFAERLIGMTLLASLSCFAVSQEAVLNVPSLSSPDDYTLIGERSFLSGYPALNKDRSVNVVVEIPSGTTAKWEVSKPEGQLKWEFKKGKPRVVNYLGYPGNYGMIPRTLLPKELGGDGDPLDVIVLGPAVARGSVVSAKVIGVLRLLDRGEQDDKLIAVMAGTPMYSVSSMAELDQSYVGVSTIIERWFSNYKGPGKMEAKGFAESKEAMEILEAAIKAFPEKKK